LSDPQLAARLAALEARSARQKASQGDGAPAKRSFPAYDLRKPVVSRADTSHAFICAERETDASVDDEAATREAWLLRIAAAVVRALDLGPSLVMETQMLAMRASSGGDRRVVQPRPQPEQASLAQGVAQAAAALARFDRERLRDGVFRPSHILPTMTIEQFGASRVLRVL
jgi:hypothetical protein